MENIMQFVYEWASKMANAIMSFLPTSPFRSFINSWDAPQYLGWLNWFIPVSQILSIMALWLTAIGLFYLYSIIMRWVKMIGD